MISSIIHLFDLLIYSASQNSNFFSIIICSSVIDNPDKVTDNIATLELCFDNPIYE